MALVMLPCDLPWWPTLQRHLTQISLAKTPRDFIQEMQKIHNMCNISLDPDEDTPDPTAFFGLETFLEQDMTPEEMRLFLENTCPAMVQRALQLKQLKPVGGFHFSLQQQAHRVEFERPFISSLLAHAFFSTFPKRTVKTHPTLQDFNFTKFFRHLDKNYQKAKLRSILQYFRQLETSEPQDKVIFSRQVMTSKNWLTIEDWLECGLPLCPLAIKHEGRMDRSDPSTMHVCFATGRIGGQVLDEGSSQECIQFCTLPELLTVLSYVEALEDNEVLMVENLLQVARINDPRHRTMFEPILQPKLVCVTCMDAENYMRLPLSQYEEDNVLRELNKALLGFRQRYEEQPQPQSVSRRLSPIGESFSSTPPETDALQKKQTPPKDEEPTAHCKEQISLPSLNGRRGRFIVLGSSGECLPVTRVPVTACSLYSSCHSESGSEQFHSARSSIEADDNDSEGCTRRYSAQLDTPERRSTFAARLRDALCRETQSSSSTDSSYAVDISVAGSGLADGYIKLHRRGSRGFVLREDSLEDEFLRESLEQEREWINKFRSKKPGALTAKDSTESSKYSFSTEYGSELEELYDQYSRWLEDANSPDNLRELDARDIAVVRFAGSLLKRTLSDSFAGVPLVEGRGTRDDLERNKTKLALVARSLSLELARHTHKLAAQVVTLLSNVAGNPSGLKPVATGNWGCGSTHVGDPQLKLVVQWLAASVAGVPYLQYYTCSHHKMLKLDTVCRVILDRQWTVSDLVTALLQYAQTTLHDPSSPQFNNCLFDELIGSERLAAKCDANL